jgi:hypothetical protein
MQTLRTGVNRAIITPEKGMYLIGFADRAGGAEGILDDLTATTLMLDDGEERAIIIALDLLVLHPDTVAQVKKGIAAKLGIEGSRILLCCSHTHSGPPGWAPEEITLSERLRELKNRILTLPAGFMPKMPYDEVVATKESRTEKKTFGTRVQQIMKVIRFVPKAFAQPKGIVANRRYLDNLVQTLVNSAVSASKNMVPVSVVHGKGTMEVSINRRERKPDGTVDLGYNPEGPIEPDIEVLQFRSGDKPLVTVVNGTCHLTVLGPNTNLISADMAGVLRARVEEKLGGFCMYIQGACGDINPNVGWSPENIPNMKKFGEQIAGAVLKAAENMKEISLAPISASEDTIDAALDVPKEMEDWPPEKICTHMIHRNVGVPLFIIEPALYIRFPWKATIKRTPQGYTTPIHLGVLRMGDVAIGWASMEVFVDIGRAVKKASSAPITIFAGYTNGYNSYLPTAGETKLGGYEVNIAPFMVRLPGVFRTDTEARVVSRFASLLEDVAARAG